MIFASRFKNGILKGVIAPLCGLALTSLSAFADTPLVVLLDWFVNPDHAPLIIAKQQGYFRDLGLAVQLHAPADPNAPPKLVAAGKADIALTYQPQLHVQIAKGLPLMRIGTLIATPLNSLVVLQDGEVQSIADLKGRKIGYSVGGFEDVLLSAMLERHQLSLDDVTLVNVNFSLSPALISGQVDAVIGAFRNFELNQMDLINRPGRAFYVEEEGVPAYDELILVVQRDYHDKAPQLRAFVDALERAVQYMVNHTSMAWAAFVSYDADLDNALNRLAFRDTLPRFALRPGSLDNNRYQRFSNWLHQRGMIDSPPPVSDYAIELRSH